MAGPSEGPVRSEAAPVSQHPSENRGSGASALDSFYQLAAMTDRTEYPENLPGPDDLNIAQPDFRFH
jgi:hypothetical protein